MRPQKGNADFFTENLASKYIPLSPAYKYNLDKMTPLGIRRFYFDKPQHEFLEYIGGNRSDSFFLKEMKNDHIDTCAFAHRRVINYLDVLTGFNSHGDFIAIPDINRNKNFKDDKSYLYKNLQKVPPDSFYQLEKSCPYQKISIQKWENGRVKSYTRFIRIVPWIYLAYNRAHLPKSVVDSSEIVVQPYQHWEGTVKIDNHKYIIYLHNRRPQLRGIPLYAVELDVRSTQKIDTSSFDTQYLYSKYQTNDTIPIGDKLFVPVGISLTAKYITLRYVGNNTGKYGYNTGSMANEIKTVDFLRNDFDLYKLRSHYVLLDFWFIGCGACEATLPDLRRLNNLYKKSGLNIVSIAMENNLTKLINYTIKNKMDWANIMSYSMLNNTNIINSFRVGVYPTFILIDPNGKIVLRTFGLDGFERVKQYISKVMVKGKKIPHYKL